MSEACGVLVATMNVWFWHDSELEPWSKNDRFTFNSGRFAVNFCYRAQLVCCLSSSGPDADMAGQPPLNHWRHLRARDGGVLEPASGGIFKRL